MMLALLILYAIGTVFFCVSSLLDPINRADISGILGWYFAIVLPIVAIAGPFLHFFEPNVGSTAYYICLVLWLTSIVAMLDEVATVKRVEGGFTVSNLLIGGVSLLLLFGPGLFLGAVWLRMTPH